MIWVHKALVVGTALELLFLSLLVLLLCFMPPSAPPRLLTAITTALPHVHYKLLTTFHNNLLPIQHGIKYVLSLQLTRCSTRQRPRAFELKLPPSPQPFFYLPDSHYLSITRRTALLLDTFLLDEITSTSLSFELNKVRLVDH